MGISGAPEAYLYWRSKLPVLNSRGSDDYHFLYPIYYFALLCAVIAISTIPDWAACVTESSGLTTAMPIMLASTERVLSAEWENVGSNCRLKVGSKNKRKKTKNSRQSAPSQFWFVRRGLDRVRIITSKNCGCHQVINEVFDAMACDGRCASAAASLELVTRRLW